MIHGPGQHDPLPLTATEIFAILGNNQVNAFFMLIKQGTNPAEINYFLQFSLIISPILQSDIIPYSIMNKEWLLLNIRYSGVIMFSLSGSFYVMINADDAIFLLNKAKQD